MSNNQNLTGGRKSLFDGFPASIAYPSINTMGTIGPMNAINNTVMLTDRIGNPVMMPSTMPPMSPIVTQGTKPGVEFQFYDSVTGKLGPNVAMGNNQPVIQNALQTSAPQMPVSEFINFFNVTISGPQSDVEVVKTLLNKHREFMMSKVTNAMGSELSGSVATAPIPNDEEPEPEPEVLMPEIIRHGGTMVGGSSKNIYNEKYAKYKAKYLSIKNKKKQW